MMDISVAKKEAKQKKKSKTWVWWVGLGAIGGLWYYNKKKKEKELAQAQAIERARTYQNQILPPVKQTIVLPTETSGSAESRLRGMGVNPDIPSPYQSDESYKEL